MIVIFGRPLGLTELLCAFLVTVILIIKFRKKKKGEWKKLPGPKPLPILGNVHQLTTKPHLQLYRWMEEYGKIYQVQFGATKAVMINDAKLARQFLFDSDFDDRPDMFPFDLVCGGGKCGIITNSGASWDEQRRWVIRKLREFGFGSSLEGIIMAEANELVDYFKRNQGKPMMIKSRFHIAVLNSLWTILSGKRLSYDDPTINELCHKLQIFPKLTTESGLALAPWLRHIFRKTFRKIEECTSSIHNFAKRVVAQHFETQEDGNIRDLIDEYIEEIKETTDPKSSFYKDAGRRNLEALVSDIFCAGSDTSSGTMNWALCYLTWKPDVQRKLQQELDAVLGSKAVALADKPNLPYTEAVVLETLRKSSMFASGVQHEARTDKIFDGYFIPKGYWITANIYNIHHDKQVWIDPENFRPERFLSPDEKTIVKNESLMPFQTGRRQCPGEGLARDTLFLFIATLFQKFNITRVETGEPQPENLMVLLHPQEYNFTFQLRPGQN